MEEKEMKAAYFAQYLNQSVFNDSYGEYLYPLLPSFLGTIADGEFIQLTPLSAITDEDAIEVSEILGFGISDLVDEDTIESERGSSIRCTKQFIDGDLVTEKALQAYDFLRSKGYALPFRQYSVEQLIEMGWLKLSTPNK